MSRYPTLPPPPTTTTITNQQCPFFSYSPTKFSIYQHLQNFGFFFLDFYSYLTHLFFIIYHNELFNLYYHHSFSWMQIFFFFTAIHKSKLKLKLLLLLYHSCRGCCFCQSDIFSIYYCIMEYYVIKIFPTISFVVIHTYMNTTTCLLGYDRISCTYVYVSQSDTKFNVREFYNR